MLLFELIN